MQTNYNQLLIGNRSPVAFEQYIKELKNKDKPKLAIWTCDLSKKQNPNQCLIQF